MYKRRRTCIWGSPITICNCGRIDTFRQKHVLHDIMTACIIMYNMIIEDERDVDIAIRDYMEVQTPEVEMVIDENT